MTGQMNSSFPSTLVALIVPTIGQVDETLLPLLLAGDLP